MQKKYRYIVGMFLIFLTAFIMKSGTEAEADQFSSLDSNTAFAGASASLHTYFESHKEASVQLAEALEKAIAISNEQQLVSGKEQKTLDEVIYAEPKIGMACVTASLNVRKDPSVLSNSIAGLFRQGEVMVVGERQVNGHLWYKVALGDLTGYCLSDYILFGEEAVQYYVRLHEAEKAAAVMPEKFDFPEEEFAALTPEAQEEINEFRKQINYCLTSEYPTRLAAEEYTNVYSVLIYILENYQHMNDLALEYCMLETMDQISIDMANVDLIRENLQDTTGTTSEQFEEEIARAQEERRQKDELTFGESIAEYAAGFLGGLPYVWGGASLAHGADCSGFCGQIFAHFGLLDQGAANVHAYDSYALRFVGYAVGVSEIMPGDLVCYNGHVAIYYGNGLVVHEPSPGKYCEIGSLYMAPIITVRRLH